MIVPEPASPSSCPESSTPQSQPRGIAMRSKLFVPGSRPELFQKALDSAADGLSFDLEDAVAQDRKAAARQYLRDFFEELPSTCAKTLVVRINALRSEHFQADLDALVNDRLDVINLPKTESPIDILELAKALDSLERGLSREHPIRILATIETPKGLRNAAAIAVAHPRVMGLQLGLADLLEPLGIDRQDPATLHQIRLAMRLAAGEAGIDCYDSAFTLVSQPQDFFAEAQAARRLGFTGKSCIHPSQIQWANRAFVPSAGELNRARRILDAAESASSHGLGAYLVEGEMIDEPLLRGARRVVEQARLAGLDDAPQQ